MCEVSFKCSDYFHIKIKKLTLCSGLNCEKILGNGDDAFLIKRVNKIICNQCCLQHHSLKCRESKGYINKALQYDDSLTFPDERSAEYADRWYDRHV